MNGDKANDGPNVVPLRNILRNFLNLVESYEARRNGGLDSYETEFQELKKLSENLKSDPGHLCKEGERTVNRKKNRYKDILPYDFSRVPLRASDDAPGSDYINANFIKGASGSSAYIACQGPLPHTVNDFWRMVVECEVQVIVMACNEHESGKHKCENYWVEDDGVEREFGDVVVWLKKCRQVCPDFSVRTMRMRYKNSQGETEERNVCQFHYSAWPDHGVPTKVRPLLDMVRLIRDCQTSETLPVLVHCSAGCGRTGTICAIDYVWGLLRLGRLTADFSLFKLVGEMRRQRIAMVQTKDQYVLVHRAVKELFQEQLRIIDSHPYANVDGNGFPVDLKPDLREPTYEVLDVRPSKSREPENKSQCDTSNSIVVSVSNVNVAGHNGDSVPAVQYTIPKRPDKEDDAIPARPSKLSGASEVVISRDRTSSRSEKRSSDTPPLSGTGTSGSSQETSVPDVQLESKPEHQVSPSPTSSLECRKSPTKGSSSGAYGILQKPFKSFFGRTAAKDDSKKNGVLPKLSRAKSDVSTRFQAFTASFSSRSGSAAPSSPVERSTKSPEKAEVKDKAKAETASNNGGETFVYNQDGKLAQVVSGVKRSKSLKITAEALAKLSGFKLDSSKSTKGKRAFTKSPSPAVSSPAPAEPVASSSKVVPPSKAEEKMSKQNGYDYDIDDRSHLRQQPILPSALDKDSDTKLVKVENYVSLKNGSQDKSKVKPHNYANVTLFPHGPSYRDPRSSREMEDINSTKKSSLDLKKKSDTVNAKMLYSSKVFPKENGYSSVFPNRRSSEKETKDPSFTSMFNKSSSSKSNPKVTPSLAVKTTSGRSGSSMNDSVKTSKVDGDDRIYIEAISSDVHVTTSLFGDEDSGSGKQESSSRGSSPDKPLLRRRVPKTNPYANYPSCVSGSPRYAAKIPLEKSLSDDKTVVYNENSNSYTRDVCIPNLRTSQGGGSIGNSSTSSSSSPKNSLPSTPTQSVDILYSNVFHRSNSGGSTATSGSSHPAAASSIPTRSNFAKGATVVTTGNQRPTSLLKQDETDRPGSSKPQQPINPKLNALRLGVGRSERRNSFRQAVCKEAQPSVNGVDDDRGASGLNCRLDGRPLYNSQAKFSVADLVPHSTAKKYEPIWPNQGAPQLESPTLNGSISQGPVDKGHDVQMKIDEIKSMLEELNTTRKSASQMGPVAQEKAAATAGSSNIKQHQSLRAPSRTQYQQGLSCFTFKKPCSYESLVDAIHCEDDRSSFDLMAATGDQARVDRQKDTGQLSNGKPAIERYNNEYVTLNQCRSPSEDIGHHQDTRFFPDNSSVPVPPPRAKRMHVNSNGTAPSDSKPWSHSKTDIDSSHYAPTGSSNTAWHTETPASYRSAPGTGSSDHLLMNASSNPKAIIKALGLFQPKAATVRSRLANGAEARDNKAKGLSNGYTVSVDCERVDVRNSGKGGNGIVNPFAMDHDRLMSGATVLSKRQYL